jgi:isoleucyl-tRNA synthetase
MVVAVDTRIDADLRAEGLARELVRHLQNLRKEAGFRLEDRIVTYLEGGAVLQDVLDRFAEYVASETLSVELASGQAPAGSAQGALTMDGETVNVGLVRRG